MASTLAEALGEMDTDVTTALGLVVDDPAPVPDTVDDADPEQDGTDPESAPLDEWDGDELPDDGTPEGDPIDGQEQQTRFKVKAAGEEMEVELDELISGYQRQADYTRSKQALAEQRAEVDAQLATVEQWYEERVADPAAWVAEIASEAGDPTDVFVGALSQYDDATGVLADTIAGLAQAGKLSPEFLTRFYPEGAPQVDRTTKALEKQLAELQQRLDGRETQESADQVRQRQVAEYRQQWQQAVDDEGMTFADAAAEQTEKQQFLDWMGKHPGVNDLRVGYAAYRRGAERGAKKAPAPQQSDDAARKALADRKRRAGALPRTSGRGSGKPIGSLDDAMGAAMAELGF